jgi:hypothetical protein
MRGCCVGPCVLKRTEAGLRLRHRVKHIEQVLRRSRQPIKPRHDQHVAGLERSLQLGQLGPLRLRPPSPGRS